MTMLSVLRMSPDMINLEEPEDREIERERIEKSFYLFINSNYGNAVPFCSFTRTTISQIIAKTIFTVLDCSATAEQTNSRIAALVQMPADCYFN